MKIFIKCGNCGSVIYTKRCEVFSLMLDGNIKVCSACKQKLDFATALICGRSKGEACELCDYRFQCFTLQPVEADFDGLDIK